jgi:prepilin-type N-terminal cleavage/methylation domain-containing protein
MKKMNQNHNAGMTLIETIVAMAIISIILVVALVSINTIASVNVKAQNVNVADETLEAMISEGAFEDANDFTLSLSIIDPSTNQPIIDSGNTLKFEIKGQIQTFVEDNTGRSLDLFIKNPANGPVNP